MSDEATLANQILEVLKREVPVQYSDHVSEFEDCIRRDLFRAAYAVLDKLRRKQDWHPSRKLEGMIQAFQIVF